MRAKMKFIFMFYIVATLLSPYIKAEDYRMVDYWITEWYVSNEGTIVVIKDGVETTMIAPKIPPEGFPATRDASSLAYKVNIGKREIEVEINQIKRFSKKELQPVIYQPGGPSQSTRLENKGLGGSTKNE